jgi:peroxiredoxin
MLETGQRLGIGAKTFELTSVSGETLRLEDLLAKGPAVAVFFKVSCPTCQLAMPYVQRILDSAGSVGPQLIAVSQDDAASTREFLKHFGVRARTLIDPAKQGYLLSNAFRIEHVPTFFVLRADGTVEHSFTGFVKSELAALGERFGTETFRADENVPALKPG